MLSVLGPGIPVFGPACLDSASLEEVIDIGQCYNLNKTGLQPVSRPVEQVHGAKMCSKNV